MKKGRFLFDAMVLKMGKLIRTDCISNYQLLQEEWRFKKKNFLKLFLIEDADIIMREA